MKTKLSKDELASWDPAITAVELNVLKMNNSEYKTVVVQVAYNTSVLEFTKDELETMLTLLEAK